MAEGTQRVTYYQGGEDGYGFAVNPQDGRSVYHWAYGMDNRKPGRAYPALVGVFESQLQFGPIAAAFEWQDSSGNPLIVYLAGNGTGSASHSFFQDNASNTTNIAFNPFTSGVLYRYDQDATLDVDEEMAFYCNGKDNDFLFRRKLDGTTDQGATTSHTVKADIVAVVGSDFWIAQGYKVSKCTTDADPGLDASYVTKIPVGLPTYEVNAIVPLGGSPIILKGEGVLIYNPALSTPDFHNILPVSPHPDNGKGGFTDGRGRVYYPTADGHIIVITFGSQSSQTPTKLTRIDRNTPWGVITAMTADLDHIYAAVEPGQQRANKGLGMVVQSDDGGVFTVHEDGSSNVNLTDGKYGTFADWNLLSDVAPDRIYIGADEPFMGAYLHIVRARTGAAGASFDLAYYDGTSWVDLETTNDATVIGARSGLIRVKTSSHENPFDLSTRWATTTVNGHDKYWLRITPGSATVLTGVRVRQIDLVPYLPPMDRSLFPKSSFLLTGCMSRILIGTWVGEEIVWQDQWGCNAARIDQLVVGRAQMSGVDGLRALYALSSFGVYAYPVGADSHPGRAAWPRLAGYSETGTVQDEEHIQALSGWDSGQTAEVDMAVVEGEHLQGDDEFLCYWKWDGADEWQKEGPLTRFPVTFEPTGKGSVLQIALAFKDGSRDAIAPYVGDVYTPAGMWRILDDDFEERGEDIQSPPTI